MKKQAGPAKKILVVYNPGKPGMGSRISELRKLLRKKNARVTVKDASSALPSADVCIVLGGDGTMLKAGRKLSPKNIPVIGVNMGSLGFLAEFSYSDLKGFIPRILSGRFTTQSRIVLNLAVTRRGRTVYCRDAINDCIIHTGQSMRVALFKVRINNEPLAEYTGDGLIFSTPTGSTAYSLAANGPIVYPELPVLAITPICPHTLSQRPIIVPSDDMVSVTIEKYKSEKHVTLSVDGQETFSLNTDDRINIKKSQGRFLLVVHPGHNYYNILQSKLGWGRLR